MFKNIFSFSGRIRRLEYGLSYIIFLVLFLFGIFSDYDLNIISFLLSIILYWFILAQGAKRCHDIGNSGLYQFVPFYILLMLFEASNKGNNKYGPNSNVISSNYSYLPKSKTLFGYIIEIVTIVLLNTLIIAICYLYIDDAFIEYPIIFLSTAVCYLIMLIFNYKFKPLPNSKSYLFRQRVIYATLVYVLVRLFTIIFQNKEFDLLFTPYDIFFVFFILGLIYIPYKLYEKIFNPPVNYD